jgi:hypothetical protein
MISLLVPTIKSKARVKIPCGAAIISDMIEDELGMIAIDFVPKSPANIENYAVRVARAVEHSKESSDNDQSNRLYPRDSFLIIGQWNEGKKEIILDKNLRHELDYWSLVQLQDDQFLFPL